ncbi:GCN5 family acetyltransferase [Sphingobacterium siyangense]|uniref:GCN5 family acetyltransferase n=1 Tax=Sphingobacterium siyangense TaxID=459529 RepID=A0A420FVA8_9SPHI|nr:helix-turn-helix domain-containing GNAT family N-acetyltransferase [Sphingobacterium siyangense]RKF36852.1 GCN5 family acetyltransferase [Sphingobacterium siyangense]
MDRTIAQIRKFNRFYTSQIGLLNQQFLESPYSLTEVRVLYELGLHHPTTAQILCEKLFLDKGYMSRMLNVFIKNNIIAKSKSESDGRSSLINLTEKGQQLLADLQYKSDEQISGLIQKLKPEEENMLVHSMGNIERLLSADYNDKGLAKAVTFREGLKPGDIGYIIHLHGNLYAKESGYSLRFEGYVAKTFYDFIEHYNPTYDKIWIAEYNQKIVGCVAIIQHNKNEGQLRWFLTHPMFRGAGIGSHLFKTALNYCKERKYKSVFLMTTNMQSIAVNMYKKAGFALTSSVESNLWGIQLYEERYDLTFSY